MELVGATLVCTVEGAGVVFLLVPGTSVPEAI